MVITKQIEIDMSDRRIVPPVHAVQCDSNTRAVAVTLTADGKAWTPPAGTSVSVAFRNLSTGHKGRYDKLPDDSAACSVAGNVVTAVLAPAVLAAPGEVQAAIVFQDKNLNQLATFSFRILVEANPEAGQTVANDYYYVSTLTEINDALSYLYDEAEYARSEISDIHDQIGQYIQFEMVDGAYVNRNGVVTSHTDYSYTEFAPGLAKTVKLPAYIQASAAIVCLNGKIVLSSYLQEGEIGHEIELSIPEHCTKVMVSCQTANKAQFYIKAQLSEMIRAAEETYVSKRIDITPTAWTNGKYLSASGVERTLVGYYLSDYIPIFPFNSVTALFDIQGAAYWVLYDADKKFIKSYGNSDEPAAPMNEMHTVDTTGAYYIRFSCSSDYFSSFRAYVEYDPLAQARSFASAIQEASEGTGGGDTTALEESLNKTNTNVAALQKSLEQTNTIVSGQAESINLLEAQHQVLSSNIQAVKNDYVSKIVDITPESWTQGKYLNSSGQERSTDGYYISDYIPVFPFTSVTALLGIQASACWVLYDAQKNVVGSLGNSAGTDMGTMQTVESLDEIGAFYIRFSCISNYINSFKAYCTYDPAIWETIPERLAKDLPYLKPNGRPLPVEDMPENGGYMAIFDRIGVVGDSLSSGEMSYGTSTGTTKFVDMYHYSWIQFIARMCGSTGFNFSKGGMSTASFLANSGGMLDKMTAEENKCKCYFIALAHNDRNNSQVIGSAADIDLTDYNNNADSYYGNYAGIIQRIKEIEPNAIIFPITAKLQQFETEGWNAAIRYMGEIFDNVYVLDMYKYYRTDFPAWHDTEGHGNIMGYLWYGKQIACYVDWIVRSDPEKFKYVQFIGTEYAQYIP